MLELKTKWFTNSLAKESILKSDFIACENGARLFIVGYGALTSSGKNTYNYELKSEDGVLLASGENAYLDKLTTLIKGASPKAKERKDNKSGSKSESEANKSNNKSIGYKETCVYKSFLAQEKKLAKAILEMNTWYEENACENKQDVINLAKLHASIFNRDARRTNEAKIERVKNMRRYYKGNEAHVATYQYLCTLWSELE